MTSILEHRGSGDRKLRIAEILDIEENIWSPKYGLKGKIDISAHIFESGPKSYPAPIEIKTGKNTHSSSSGLSHRAQTSLYTLMMNDRYGCFLFRYISYLTMQRYWN